MKILMIISAIVSIVRGSVKEDFNSLDELKQNWWISNWGHAPKQYDKNLVSVSDGILQLSMVPDTLDGKPRPRCSEITYSTEKFQYGSFRASIKTTTLSGGVVGWFVYKDGVPGDGQLHEIDMEILTEDITQIHYTLHHDEYSVDHTVDQLGFDPSAAFHEYRFDWYPDSVVYYVDGLRRYAQTHKVPDDSCQIMLNYWSNNNKNWGGDMPDSISHMWVDYMHFFPLNDQTALIKNSPFGARKGFAEVQRGNITITPPRSGTYQLSLYSLNGTEIYSELIAGVTAVDIAELGSGLVILRLNGRRELMTQKLILH